MLNISKGSLSFNLSLEKRVSFSRFSLEKRDNSHVFPTKNVEKGKRLRNKEELRYKKKEIFIIGGTMKGLGSFGLFLGRLCLATIFVMAGIGKFLDFEGTAKYMESAGMTMIPFFLYGAAVVEILGGLSVFLGFKTRLGATLLLLFLIPTTIIFHGFWNLEGAMRMMQTTEFLKNLAIMGGLLYVIVCGPGRMSLDGSGAAQTTPKT